jgi:hypothetical protein
MTVDELAALLRFAVDEIDRLRDLAQKTGAGEGVHLVDASFALHRALVAILPLHGPRVEREGTVRGSSAAATLVVP